MTFIDCTEPLGLPCIIKLQLPDSSETANLCRGDLKAELYFCRTSRTFPTPSTISNANRFGASAFVGVR